MYNEQTGSGKIVMPKTHNYEFQGAEELMLRRTILLFGEKDTALQWKVFSANFYANN